ncbi:FkbM family methyltransferase [Noviherbaspirillum denitrificans]|uniref:Methyltransferase FkbM domain-containing protein n=1 Tax=Noviherbaspirillum denitrificans TaxID=1968433 RepID=A0A254TD24_9BURK|nr:FkbM family methyltransferase [Noviherbaspirillum denitrificans]OWW20549.1 hypothetical protein AYR66_14675 [Noviherbaspirillum denitrificans]
MSAEAFHPYIARNRVLEPYTFDFHIEDETARLWYDGSPRQWMPERQWCLEHIQEGFNILDCGAHHGMMAILFAKKTGTAGKVIAWEALPSNARVVEKNAALNGLPNVIVRPFGIGAQRATVAFDRNAGNVVVKNDDVGPATGTTETIEIVALDDDIDPKIRVDFMKIDVEGSDLEALKGARRVLSQRPIIDLEIHNFLFGDREGTLREIFAILDGYGYTYEVLPEVFSEIVKIEGTVDLAWLAQHDNPHVFCVPPERDKGVFSGIWEKAGKLVKGLRTH